MQNISFLNETSVSEALNIDGKKKLDDLKWQLKVLSENHGTVFSEESTFWDATPEGKRGKVRASLPKLEDRIKELSKELTEI